MTTALLIMLAVLQALDAMTTLRILDQGGRELNPFMRAAIRALGFWPAFSAKGAAVVALGAFGATQAGIATPGLLVALYAAVVAWNWRQMRRR